MRTHLCAGAAKARTGGEQVLPQAQVRPGGPFQSQPAQLQRHTGDSKTLENIARHRAASRPGLCAIAPGLRAGAPPPLGTPCTILIGAPPTVGEDRPDRDRAQPLTQRANLWRPQEVRSELALHSQEADSSHGSSAHERLAPRDRPVPQDRPTPTPASSQARGHSALPLACQGVKGWASF